MKKNIEILLILILTTFLFIASVNWQNILFPSHSKSNNSYHWNNGHCEIDGGRLDYVGTGNKEHYRCEICGKEYTFDQVMSYK